jgi:hypothetical protein
MDTIIKAAAEGKIIKNRAGEEVRMILNVTDAEPYSRLVWYNTESKKIYTTNEYGVISDRRASDWDIDSIMPNVKIRRHFVDTPEALKKKTDYVFWQKFLGCALAISASAGLIFYLIFCFSR